MLEKLGHYSLTTPASVYDEEALTALELAGRTAAKTNEAVEAFNVLEKETGDHLQAQDKTIEDRMKVQDDRITKMNDETMPEKVTSEVQKRIDDGSFDDSIDHYAGELTQRLDNLLGSVTEGSTVLDAEVIDARVTGNGQDYESLGIAIRDMFSKTPYYKRSLTEEDALDNLISPGCYYVSAGIEGNFFEIASMLVVEGLTNIVVQTLTCLYNGEQKVRTKASSNANWSEWRYASKVYKRSLTPDDDLETFFSEGDYWVSRYKPPMGTLPSFEGGYAMLKISSVSTNWVVQELITTPANNVNPQVFIRTYYNEWTDWIEVTRSQNVTEIPSVWAGKTLHILGDSITAGGQLAGVIRDTLGLGNIRVYGVGGARMASTEFDSQYTPVCQQYQNMEADADIIIVHAGTNDWSTQVPLGDEEGKDVTTFNGALNTIMEGLREMYPDKLIIFSSILHRYNDNAGTTGAILTDDYRKAIEDRCKANHIIFYDSYKYTGFDFVKGYYDHVLTDDGLHPNARGYEIFGRKLAGFINWQ